MELADSTKGLALCSVVAAASVGTAMMSALISCFGRFRIMTSTCAVVGINVGTDDSEGGILVTDEGIVKCLGTFGKITSELKRK
jgi:hypothetical protein